MSRAKGLRAEMRLEARLVVGLLAAAALAGCATERARPVRASLPDPPPVPANGLWAVMEPGCHAPLGADRRAWPACAYPVWLRGGAAVVIQTLTSSRERSYETRFQLVSGDPLIAKVGIAIGASLFVALADITRDGDGRLIGAAGVPIACLEGATSFRVGPMDGGCDAVSPDALRDAARQSLGETASRLRTRLDRAWRPLLIPEAPCRPPAKPREPREDARAKC